ncbi:MAG: hypothetical protein WBQ18_20215 [Solirubrobacteraceae bacterium]
MHRLSRALLLSATVALLLPFSAAAHPGHRGLAFGHRDRGLAGTFPHAERLCQRAAAGSLPHSLSGDTAQITAACSTLSSAFASSQTALSGAVTQAQAAVAAARSALQATVAQARQNRDHVAAQAARQTFVAAVRAAAGQLRAAVTQYVAANQTARRAFWTTVHALRGAHGIPGDTTTPAPSVPVITAG